MRVIARIRRLLPKNRDLRKRFSIGVNELNEAESTLVEFIQRDAFPQERRVDPIWTKRKTHLLTHSPVSLRG